MDHSIFFGANHATLVDLLQDHSASLLPTIMLNEILKLFEELESSPCNVQLAQAFKEWPDIPVRELFRCLHSDDKRHSLLRFLIHHEFTDLTLDLLAETKKISRLTVLETIWFGTHQVFNSALTRFEDWEHEPTPEILLMIAITIGDLYKAAKLIAFTQLDINQETLSETPIEFAARVGNIDMAALILEEGASKNLTNASEIAADAGHFAISDLIKAEIRRHANPTSSQTPQTMEYEMTPVIPHLSPVLPITQAILPSPGNITSYDAGYIPTNPYEDPFSYIPPIAPYLDQDFGLGKFSEELPDDMEMDFI